jgi:3-phosphoshikimate 1-carboxyvinyltransferase
MGAQIDKAGTVLTVTGTGAEGLSKPAVPLHCGNSGTTMRLLAGLVASLPFDSILTGDESLSRRPMQRIIEPLSRMGAEIQSVGGHAPLTIKGNSGLNGIEFEMPIASAQIKSCLLLAGMNAEGETTVIEKTPTRDHTERMLKWFGVTVAEEIRDEGKAISVLGRQELTARDIDVPSDLSSAAFFAVAAACLNGSQLTMPGVGVNSTRKAIIDVLSDFGVELTVTNVRESANEPVADVVVRGSRSRRSGSGRNVLNGRTIANLIDEIPILAVFGTQLEGGLEVRDAAELRVKESDRIASIVSNLRRMNASVHEFDDGFRVERSDLHGAEVESFGDHRIAMAFAIAGLLAETDTVIKGAECAAVSFPDFFETLESCTSR